MNEASAACVATGEKSGADRVALADVARSELRIAVVVCTHNRPALLERCLTALRRVEYRNFSTLVVDSAPTSNDAWELSRRFRAGYVASPIRGVSRARNIGARAADGEIVAFLDDDMVPKPRWLAALVKHFADPQVAAVTGPWVPLETVASEAGELDQALEACSLGATPFQLHLRSLAWFERANFGGLGDGNFAVRREVFQRDVEFDQNLGRGVLIGSSEEHYFYFRLLTLGYAIAYEPEAIVLHPVSPPDRQYEKRLIAQSCAYILFLAWRHPHFLRRILKYCVESLLGVRRPWRSAAPDRKSARRVKAAIVPGALAGLWLFLKYVWADGCRTGTEVEEVPYRLRAAAHSDERATGQFILVQRLRRSHHL